MTHAAAKPWEGVREAVRVIHVRCPSAAIAVLMLVSAVRAQSDLAADLADSLRKGLYDEVVATATEHIAEAEQPDPKLIYLRGQAAYRIGWFGVAEADLTPLGDFRPWDDWPPASECAARVTEMRRLAPARVHEIPYGGAVIFRIYYDGQDPWTETIISALPEAYQKVCELYAATLAETAVFIFSDGPRYNAFIRAWCDTPPRDWQWAGGSTGSLYFCERDADGTPSSAPGSDYLRSSLAHEFSHCLLRRFLGTTPFPPWLNEGLAMLSGALMSPGDHDLNDRRLAQAVADEALLPMGLLQSRDGFYQNETIRTAYVQAFAMARFLDSRIGRQGITQLLNLLKQEGDIDKALQKGWGVNSQQLYDTWFEATIQMVREGGLAP
jgi:hypothetical protein